MAIKYYEEAINRSEMRRREPYTGYIAPNGDLISFSTLFGGSHHDDWRNPVSQEFLSWVSYIVEGTSIKNLREHAICEEMIINNQYPGIDEYVIRGCGTFYDFNYENMDYFLNLFNEYLTDLEEQYKEYGGPERGYDAFAYQLLLFFKNAYKNKTFFETIGRQIRIENPEEVKKRLGDFYNDMSDSEIESIYHNHLKDELIRFFKDICVQYLGYDSIERFKPDGSPIEIPYSYQNYDFDFQENPRIITSSYPNTNERYYNYLLMDWDVHKLPRYNFNEKTGLYERSDFNIFYQSDKEEKIGKEIQSIKKLVPLKERPKYFR